MAWAQNYTPRETGAKTRSGRLVNSISVNGDVYTLPNGTRYSYTDETDEKTFTVWAGETITLGMTQTGAWMNAYVYIDQDQNGFTAGIGSDGYTPTGDLVSYSFYNNGASSDANGYNSVGMKAVFKIHDDTSRQKGYSAKTATRSVIITQIGFKVNLYLFKIGEQQCYYHPEQLVDCQLSKAKSSNAARKGKEGAICMMEPITIDCFTVCTAESACSLALPEVGETIYPVARSRYSVSWR